MLLFLLLTLFLFLRRLPTQSCFLLVRAILKIRAIKKVMALTDCFYWLPWLKRRIIVFIGDEKLIIGHSCEMLIWLYRVTI